MYIMNNKIKKNLWWIISSFVLFIPLALLINGLRIENSEQLGIGATLFCVQLVIWAIIGIIANKINKIVLKVLWIIVGLLFNIVFLTFSAVILAMAEPVTENDVEIRKESFRDMVYNEFNVSEYLDTLTGIQLPSYRIVDSECDYVTFFPTETEYNVELKIHFPEGLSDSIREKIYKLASEKASNPHSKGNVINEWSFGENNPKEIFYRTEDASSVGCVVLFKPQCDTIYVTRYKW